MPTSAFLEEDEAGKLYRRFNVSEKGWAIFSLYDSLQAFSSSIAGLLASRAVLEGVGVGDANASATHALLLTITQDAVSRLATILFAWRIGTALEPEAKRYRLLADIFNDGAMIMDCLSPALPKPIRVFVLCMSGSLRALCGVAAGGAKAALSVHFAKFNNIGDLNAKDSSQETVIGLLGMLAGSFIVSRVTSPSATWSLLLLLLVIHLFTNYLAVRAVTMDSLNRQRTNIVYEHYRTMRKVLTPSEVAKKERIFAAGGTLSGQGGAALGSCQIGTGLEGLFPTPDHPEAYSWTQGVLHVFALEEYLLWINASSFTNPSRYHYCISLTKESKAPDHIKAWIHAIELAHLINEAGPLSSRTDETLKCVERSLETVNSTYSNFLPALTLAGWDTHHGALLTTPCLRLRRVHHEVVDDKKSR
ncbi:vitamin B6 photo-protection and homoeostasis-domain-containing protein [Hysterangium stoloniferum]|nr:vitamin B6 photo-protection and homoeostasis-domain-containing protein [Hysterangium stoloniferum]